MKEKQKYTQMIDDDKQRHGNKQFEQKKKQKKTTMMRWNLTNAHSLR